MNEPGNGNERANISARRAEKVFNVASGALGTSRVPERDYANAIKIRNESENRR